MLNDYAASEKINWMFISSHLRLVLTQEEEVRPQEVEEAVGRRGSLEAAGAVEGPRPEEAARLRAAPTPSRHPPRRRAPPPR